MINQARLDELKSEVGEDDFREVVQIFCEEVEEVLSDLETMEELDFASKLHFLKGSALNLGLDQVSAICQQAEAQVKADPAFVPDIGAIRDCYDASKAQLSAFG